MKNHTDITIVLDRSGSMSSIASDTIGGFNSFLKDQKEAPGTANITLYQFDDKFETVFLDKDIQSAEDLTGKTFVPRGMTALLDAIGRSINETGERLAKLNDPDIKVVFVIITDGEENSSNEFTQAKINDMIKHQTDVYSWQFLFLAANQDAIKTGDGLGILRANAMTYAANHEGTSYAFQSTSRNLVNFRSGATCSAGYTDDDREEQFKAGA